MVLGISVSTCADASCLDVIRTWMCTRDTPTALPLLPTPAVDFGDCFTALYQFPGSVGESNGPASSAWVDFCAVWDQYSGDRGGSGAACPQPFDQALPAGANPELAGYVENICSTHHTLFWDQVLGTLASGFYDPDAESWSWERRRLRLEVSGVGADDPIEPILIACFNRETSTALVPVLSSDQSVVMADGTEVAVEARRMV